MRSQDKGMLCLNAPLIFFVLGVGDLYVGVSS